MILNEGIPIREWISDLEQIFQLLDPLDAAPRRLIMHAIRELHTGAYYRAWKPLQELLPYLQNPVFKYNVNHIMKDVQMRSGIDVQMIVEDLSKAGHTDLSVKLSMAVDGVDYITASALVDNAVINAPREHAELDLGAPLSDELYNQVIAIVERTAKLIPQYIYHEVTQGIADGKSYDQVEAELAAKYPSYDLTPDQFQLMKSQLSSIGIDKVMEQWKDDREKEEIEKRILRDKKAPKETPKKRTKLEDKQEAEQDPVPEDMKPKPTPKEDQPKDQSGSKATQTGVDLTQQGLHTNMGPNHAMILASRGEYQLAYQMLLLAEDKRAFARRVSDKIATLLAAKNVQRVIRATKIVAGATVAAILFIIIKGSMQDAGVLPGDWSAWKFTKGKLSESLSDRIGGMKLSNISKLNDATEKLLDRMGLSEKEENPQIVRVKLSKLRDALGTQLFTKYPRHIGIRQIGKPRKLIHISDINIKSSRPHFVLETFISGKILRMIVWYAGNDKVVTMIVYGKNNPESVPSRLANAKNDIFKYVDNLIKTIPAE